MGRSWTIEEVAPEDIDAEMWSRSARSTFPEAQLGWLRFLNSAASGYRHRIRVLCASSGGVFEAALVFSEAQRTFMTAHGVKAAWQQVRAAHPEAKGLRCWFPLSIYHGVLGLPSVHPTVLSALFEHLITQARGEGCHFVSVPGVPRSAQALHQALQELSGFQADGLAGTQVALTGFSLEDHLASLNYDRRRDLRRFRQDFLREGGSVVRRQSLSEAEALQCWDLLQATADRYGGGPLVQLPFLRHCGTPAGVDCGYLLLMREGEIYSFVFLLFGGEFFAAKFFGSRYDENRSRLHPYWNALIAAVETGFEHGCRYGLFGPTMYAEKCRLGCELLPTIDYLFAVSNSFKDAIAGMAVKWQPERKDPAGR